MNIYERKDGRFESRIPNGKKPDGKRAFLYVLARTKEQCIERVQAICQQNRPQGYCALTIAELFSEWHRSILHIKDESIQNDSAYIISLCRSNSDVQALVDNIPKEKQVNVALISNIAMTASDFAKVSKEQTDAYRMYNWDYTGLGRYYDEEQRCFGWATIIIYETE